MEISCIGFDSDGLVCADLVKCFGSGCGFGGVVDYYFGSVGS